MTDKGIRYIQSDVSAFCCFLLEIIKANYRPYTVIGVRDGGAGGAAAPPPPIRAVCRHEFGQRGDIIRAKHPKCLNNTNLGSVTAGNGKKPRIEGLLLELTGKIEPPHIKWIPENCCYYPPPPPLNTDPGKFLLLPPPPPPTESIRAKLGLPPPNGCWPVRRCLHLYSQVAEDSCYSVIQQSLQVTIPRILTFSISICHVNPKMCGLSISFPPAHRELTTTSRIKLGENVCAIIVN